MKEWNANGYTKVLHWPNPNNKHEVTRLQGILTFVFENLGKLLINHRIACSKELNAVLLEQVKFYGFDDLRKNWVEAQKKFIDETKIDLSDEFYELMSYHYSKLDWRQKVEFDLRYAAKSLYGIRR